MHKPLTLVATSTALAIAIVVGCSAPSPDGTGLARGSSSSSSGGGADGSSSSSSSSSSGGSVSCDNRAKVDDRPACDQCVRANCCKQIVACDDEPDCDALQKCAEACNGEIFCQFGCRGAHEPGAAVLDRVGSCAQSKCTSECPSNLPDGGDPFADAF